MSTDTNAMTDSVTSLTWDQLTAAMIASCEEYETRFAAFLAASEAEIAYASIGHPSAEAHALSETCWAACKAQSAMTGAIAAEMRARQLRKDYGPTATEIADAPRGLASCGHPADEDGECSCSSWPERAPNA